MSLLLSLLCPPKCVCCGERLPFDAKIPFCGVCHREWESETEECCGFCQKPVKDCLCVTPLMERAGIHILFKSAYYKAGKKTSPNRALFSMKESASPRLYSFLEETLAPKILAYLHKEKIPPSDCLIVFAPRHKRALSASGLDQAERLSRRLSEALEIPTFAAICRARTKNKVQKTLNPSERIKNAAQAFSLKRGVDLSGKTILLVDDTVTTGATMAACAKLLKSAGAKRILGVSFTLDEVGRNPKEAAISTKPYS